ncbi:MAG TPA: heparinase II/III family protein [Bryobacterales bacterium]|nr:heparinase II/III family protein [Bryobacterales bacterium]
MSVLITIRRYAQALQFQTAEQIAGRVRLAAAFGLYRVLTRIGLGGWIEQACDLRSRDACVNPGFVYPEAFGEEQGGCLGAGRFCFLNEVEQLGEPVEWNPPAKSLLWRFHLNYFDWAPRLAVEAEAELERQVASWIRANPAGRQPAWHPYPTSLRIVNWARSLQLLGMASGRVSWAASLRQQAAFLESHLEVHLGGNHLIENAFALLLAGLFFEGGAARRWERVGLALLTAELRRQVLPDGGHIERSLSYHVRVNLVCREALRLLEANGREAPRELAAIHERMSAFTAALLHTDGNVPLFHDSQLIEPSTWKRFQTLHSPLTASV